MGRFLVIGDIHGGLNALTQAFERAKVSTDDQLLFLGDYVDGWDHTYEVIEYLINLNKTHKCIFLRGNHDVWCEEYLRLGIEPTVSFNIKWSDRGGTSTMRGYEKYEHIQRHEHLTFFRLLEPYYHDMYTNKAFVHGGYSSVNGLGEGNSYRDYLWDRQLLNIAFIHEQKNGDDPEKYKKNFPKILGPYNEIYVGHTTTQIYGTLKPLRVCNLINLDTGAGHGEGKLTIMDSDTKEYWQSDRLKDLYSDDPQCNFLRGKYSEL